MSERFFIWRCPDCRAFAAQELLIHTWGCPKPPMERIEVVPFASYEPLWSTAKMLTTLVPHPQTTAQELADNLKVAAEQALEASGRRL